MQIPKTARELNNLFRRNGIRADGKKGQNFLVDANLLRFVAESAELTRDDVVLEVGTGTGLLAREIAARCGHLLTIEIDRGLASLAEGFLAGFDNVTIMLADILAKKSALNPDVTAKAREMLNAHSRSISGEANLKIVSNLPYGISTPFIGNVAEGALPFAMMVLMVQEEVADRLAAAPGTKEYGFLTAIVRYHCDVVLLKTIPPQVFWPRPEVSSTVIKIVPHPVETPAKDYAAFRALCRAIFNHRRKSLLNSLAHSGLGEKAALSGAIRSAGIEPGLRGENLTVEEMVALSDFICRSDSSSC